MEKKEFKEIVKRTKFAELSQQAAELLFVDEKKPSEVAEKTGLSPTRVSQISKTFRNAAEEFQREKQESRGLVIEAIDVSLHEVVRQTRDAFGQAATIEPARPGEICVGPVVGQAEFHCVQRVGPNDFRLHELAKLNRVPEKGAKTRVEYDKTGFARVNPPERAFKEKERGGLEL